MKLIKCACGARLWATRARVITRHHCPPARLGNRLVACYEERQAEAVTAPTFNGIAASFWSSPVTAAGGLALLVLLWLSGCV